MLVFFEDLNKLCQVFEKLQHFILSIIYKGSLLTSQHMIWVVLTKAQLLWFRATYGPKICTEYLEKVKIQSYKV